jgi:hypothetical protein
MYKYVIDETNQRYSIYVNLISSAAGQYLKRRPYVLGLLKEVLSAKELRGDRIVIEQDMGRDIGTSDVVLTSERDVIYYAQVLKSETFSRIARNRAPQVSTAITIVLQKDVDGNYEVTDTWVGSSYPAVPGDAYETENSKMYWETHAFVQDALSLQTKSITKVCPY